jgi:CheY-like chemotaxis protein
MPDDLEPDRPGDSAGRSGHICVVDDDPDIRQCLRFLLEDEGYAVEEADNGEAALGLLQSDPRPRVLLLDRMMPRLDGIQTLRRLEGGPAEVRQRTVILFMTARHDPPEPESMGLIHRSTFATVIKPFDLDWVLATVARASEHLAG